MSDTAAQLKSPIRFGLFEFDSRSGELRKSGIRIKLQDQPLQILKMLLEHPGEVVTREQIQARLWPDGTFVEFDNAINSAVRRLRDALSDKAENPRFIETLARRGYRFIAPASCGSEPRDAESAVPQPRRPAEKHRSPRPIIAGVLASAALAALATIVVQRANSRVEPHFFTATPLTTYPGAEIEPAFSPDGTRVAFAWNGPAQDNFDIYVKLIGAGDPVRLTRSAAADRSPAWSPDGQWIAFLRELSDRESAIVLVPALGGPERELSRIGFVWIHTWAVPGRYLSWSPDGKTIFVVDARMAGMIPSHRIIGVSVESGNQQVLTSPVGVVGDGSLAPSPDGRVLAFTRTTAYSPRELFSVQLSGGPNGGSESRITAMKAAVLACALEWTPDGGELLFSTCGHGIWRMPASGTARAVRLVGVGENARDLAVARQGGRLVYSDGGEDQNIWRIGINGNSAQPAPFIASTRKESNMQYSPDGQRIAFESDRSGVEEIWVSDHEGSNAVQLTSFGEGWSGTPRWSPDGRTIAFDRSQAGGRWAIYVISSQGGKPRSVVQDPFNNTIPSWSRDGRWIYFTSGRMGRLEIFKINASGGPVVQVTKHGGVAATESPDGSELYYNKTGETGGLWKMPVQGGAEQKILDSVYDRNYFVTARGIYFETRKLSSAQARYFDFGSRRITRIASYRGGCPGLAVSPDERWLLVAPIDLVAGDLMLVENFR
jgi:Tol biopolymer transport system component/DNA-binding winged helix-turn-helix (wHTH) protein